MVEIDYSDEGLPREGMSGEGGKKVAWEGE